MTIKLSSRELARAAAEFAVRNLGADSVGYDAIVRLVSYRGEPDEFSAEVTLKRREVSE